MRAYVAKRKPEIRVEAGRGPEQVFIEQDGEATATPCTLPWSSGVVEGQVNRIKMRKRKTFGRAAFRLLRKRVLLSL